MSEINLGVIGAGRIGRLHARNLKYQVPGARLAAISDVLKEAADGAAAELAVPVSAQDYRVLLDDPNLDAVAICSSTDTHARIIMDAAAAGKDIFCEKPIALDLAEIDEALAAVDRYGVKLMLGFNRRFDPGFSRAREMVATGRIGVPHLLRITSRDPQPPPPSYVKVSGGIFLDMTIHDFDMARFLMGEATELLAAGACLIDPEIGTQGDVDTALVLLKFASGALGAIDNSRRAVYGYDQRIEVFGSEGMVGVGNRKPNEVMLYGAEDVCQDKPLFFFVERYREAYIAEMEHFLACLRENRQPNVSGLDGKRSTEMGYAAKKSMATGAFVRLDNA